MCVSVGIPGQNLRPSLFHPGASWTPSYHLGCSVTRHADLKEFVRKVPVLKQNDRVHGEGPFHVPYGHSPHLTCTLGFPSECLLRHHEEGTLCCPVRQSTPKSEGALQREVDSSVSGAHQAEEHRTWY